jgi:hypothetical protein
MSIYKIYTNTLVNNAKPEMTLYIELQIMSIYKIYIYILTLFVINYIKLLFATLYITRKVWRYQSCSQRSKKDIKYNGQKKKDKITNYDLQSTMQTSKH